MDYINVKLPGFYAKKIDVLVESGRFSSRAEVVREALRILFRQVIAESPTPEAEMKVEVA